MSLFPAVGKQENAQIARQDSFPMAPPRTPRRCALRTRSTDVPRLTKASHDKAAESSSTLKQSRKCDLSQIDTADLKSHAICLFAVCQPAAANDKWKIILRGRHFMLSFLRTLNAFAGLIWQ
ncbi:hypothetical protein ACMYSQ_008675 [Aspergillus niger]